MFFAFLSIISALVGHTAQASPPSTFHQIHPRFDVLDPSQSSCPNTRSLLGVIWSCFGTVFLCLWVSVHPNVPPPGESWWRTNIRRIKLMFWGLVAPEAILTWAVRQWLIARQVSREYEGRGWTMTHGFFLIMGGFVLFKGEEDLGTISFETFKELEAAGELEFPSLTREEINDKTKCDFIAKGLVILQTSWFIVQCIARGIQDLDLTELELVTLGFTSLNAAMYYFWWYKPMDVQCRVPVHLKPSSNFVLKFDLQRAEEITEVDHASRQVAEALEEKLASVRDHCENHTGESNLWIRLRLFVQKSMKALKKTVKRHASEFMTRRRQDLRRHNIIFLVLFIWPIAYPIVIMLRPISELVGSPESEQVKPGRNRVPTFYAPALSRSMDAHMLNVFGFTGCIFGALHCVAWKFPFPTYAEHIIWRVLSLFITLVPLTTSLIQMSGVEERLDYRELGEVRDRRIDVILDKVSVWVASFGMILVMLYVPARLILLFQALALLRDLPPSALLDITWADFLPHL